MKITRQTESMSTTSSGHQERRILVIEDDADLRSLISIHLRDLGSIEHATDGNEGLEKATATEWDLVILDLGLPLLDGTEICKRIRLQSAYTPILMLTARSSELDRIVGLEIGADDYLTKPFNVLELVARVKAIFRRIEALQAPPAHQNEIRAGGLRIDQERREVRLDGELLHLTAKEFDLLCQFAQHPGRVYTRADLLDLVWGYSHSGYEHTVNSHINRLRSKIESDPSHPDYIVTVWGVGYKFHDFSRGDQ